MPQVFGSEELRLIAESSLWTEAANNLFGQFIDQEGFNFEKPSTPAQANYAAGRQTYTRDLSKDLGPKTINNQAPKFNRETGALTNGDGYHEFVVHVNHKVDEGAREPTGSGPRRYELSYHHMDRNGRLHTMSLWSGNTPQELDRQHEKHKMALAKFMGRS
jgi:hypothetical protein